MTRKRSTASEKKQRLLWAMRKIDQGVGFSELASLVRNMGCSRRNARRVMSDAHKEWMDIAFGAEEIDQRDLLFQQVARLERTARKAEEAGQFAVIVGCVAQLNKMMALGADQKGFRGHPSHAYRR